MPYSPDQIPENVEYAAQELLEAPTDQRPAMLEGIRVEWAERFAAMSIEKPVFERIAAGEQGAEVEAGDQGQGSASPEKGTLRHATVKELLDD